jgi:hypothetical protein
MDELYLILPYFNYFNNIYRKNNLEKFLFKYFNLNNLKIILVEGIFSNQNALQDYSSLIYKHVKFDIPQRIWIKENLINLIIQNHLPKDAKYISWIDADIFFSNQNWVNDTISLLKDNDIVQMFDHAIDLKKDVFDISSSQDIMKLHSSYIFNIINNIQGKNHTGFGWAINKKFYNKIGKLWDYNIIGSADSIIARSSVQSLTEECIFKKHNLNPIYSKKYGEQIYDYYKKFKDTKFNHLNSSIMHLWHGTWESKKYVQRHEILKKYNFDISFLTYNSDGIIHVNNSDIYKEIENYLITREILLIDKDY